MSIHTFGTRGRSPGHSGRAVVFASTLSLALAGLALTGCTRSEPPPPKAEVKTVEAYGVTLDPSATPQQVVFVLLRSVADDYAAARSKDRQAQRKAQETTFSVAAFATIERELLRTANAINPSLNKKDLGPDRDDKLFKTVHYWGPIIGHYLASFEKITPQELNERSWAVYGPEPGTAKVFLPVSHHMPPKLDTPEDETATIQVELTREPGTGGEFWRVSLVRFLGRQVPPVSSPVTVQAYGLTLDDAATPQQVTAVLLRSLAQAAQAGQSGNKDLRVSALYRASLLASPAQAVANTAGKGMAETIKTTGDVAQAWARQVATVPSVQDAKPEQIQSTPGPDGKSAQAVCNGVTTQIVQQPFGGKNYWRVADVSVAPASAPAK